MQFSFLAVCVIINEREMSVMRDELELLPVKSDFVFKLIFGDQRNADVLTGFLKSVLDIPEEEYDRLTIVDPHMKKESKDDKYGILDVKIHTKSGTVISIEIQVEPIPDMMKLIIYGQSKMITEQIRSGNDWAVINRIVTIIITDYPFIPGSMKYHEQFRNRTEYGLELTSLTEINTLDLSKLPSDTDDSDLWYWAKFMATDQEEVLDMLAERSPELRKAVGVLKELSADERTRMLAEEREIARRDYVSRIDGARQEGIIEGIRAVARNLLNLGRPITEIMEATGLTREQIDALP
jgi:predicted transposase/invertase (TIGR01784 family)